MTGYHNCSFDLSGRIGGICITLILWYGHDESFFQAWKLVGCAGYFSRIGFLGEEVPRFARWSRAIHLRPASHFTMRVDRTFAAELNGKIFLPGKEGGKH